MYVAKLVKIHSKRQTNKAHQVLNTFHPSSQSSIAGRAHSPFSARSPARVAFRKMALSCSAVLWPYILPYLRPVPNSSRTPSLSQRWVQSIHSFHHPANTMHTNPTFLFWDPERRRARARECAYLLRESRPECG